MSELSTILIASLVTIVAALVAYIFLSFRKDTSDRFRHMEKLIEQMVDNNNKMVENNNKLGELIKEHDYRLRIVEKKTKINI